jgi:hypothetical protein
MINNYFARYIFAVVVTYLITVLIVSYLNTSSIVAMGVEMTLYDRLNTAWFDLLGMANYYLPIIALSLVIAFVLIKKALYRLVCDGAFSYALSGFLGIAVMHLTLKHLFDLSVFDLTPALLGLMLQCAAGAVGGWTFYRLRPSGQG